MWTHEAQPRESTTFWPLLWRVWLSIRVQTTLKHIRFVKYTIQIKNEILKSQLQLEPKASGFDRVCSFPWLESCEKNCWKIQQCTLHTAGAPEIWINWSIRIQQAWKTSLSWRKGKLTGIAVESHNFFHWRWHWIFTKMDLQFPKPYQIVKSEKYEKFSVSRLPIWRQTWVPSFQHGNSLVVRRVSPLG